MPYTANDAKATLFNYLKITGSITYIPNTANRGFLYLTENNEECVIFLFPISRKEDNTKNFFDTRDSGPFERGIAWKYANSHNYKYFCLAVNDKVDKYKDYIFSLECNEEKIAEVAGTVNGRRAESGTQVVIPNDWEPNKDFERRITRNGFYISAIHKDLIQKYLSLFDNRAYMNTICPETQNEKTVLTDKSFTHPRQIIYYGVPGSGKSYKIDDQLKTHFDFTKEQIETNTMRVVFHPEYTNADFVGQVMPVISDSNTDTKVTYKFTPGPFAKILRKAYQHPDENYCLIIEEINRGNAAAIFGDIFQLLDRLGENEVENTEYTQGWSKYFISNDYLNWYIRENVYDENDKDRDLGKAEKGEDVANKAIKIEGRKFTENTGIRLPPNLSLLATMNTSDQNVFTLDNAFQRRWDMQLVENIFGISDEEKKQQNAIIVSKDGNVTWKKFQQEINSLISEKSNEVNLSSMEDKRIGCWFVKAENGEININQFKNKVLKYLWDDAFKFCRLDVFEKGIDSFEKLQESFAEKGFTVIPALQGKLTFSKETPSPNADTGNAGNTGTAAEDTPQAEV